MRTSLLGAALFTACELGQPPDARTAPDACAVPDEAPVRDAAVPDASPDAPPDAPPDPCDFRARVPLRLRSSADGRSRMTELPAGTALDLLRVTSQTRGTLARLGVLCGVRVRESGAEGSVYLDAYEVARCQESRVSAPDVAEEHRVTVDGVDEVWRVRFTQPPAAPAPVREEADCAEWYFRGFDPRRAVIERVRDGVVVERFEDPAAGVAVEGQLPPISRELLIPARVRLPAGQRAPTLAQSERLPRPTILSVGDYDHDGRAVEFVLDLGPFICGNSLSGVVGLSRDRPRLHLLEWASPARARMILLGAGDWDEVRAEPSGDMVIWRCGNHGYDGEERLRWAPFRGGLRREVYVVPMTEDCAPIDGGAPEE